jgi:hypothetical protein
VRTWATTRRDKILDVKESLLDALVEERLQSVAFSRGDLQLVFGDARFTAYVWPTVTIGDATLQLGDRGYRDALCAFIEHEVTAAEESPERGLVIHFELGEIVANPEPTDLDGPEIAQLRVYDPLEQTTRWMVWRPGEDNFTGPKWI